MALKHIVPRKINVPPPMILGLTGGQSFFWVATMILYGVIASSFSGWATLWAWLTVFALLIFELAFLRFVNSRRRALVGHSIMRAKSLLFEPRRFTGRGFSPEAEDPSSIAAASHSGKKRRAKQKNKTGRERTRKR